jgi:hypothetical protein
MSKITIGLLFISIGLLYGSLAFDPVYDKTLGYLVKEGWIKLPEQAKQKAGSLLGRKPTIILYSLGLIIIGIYILWNRNT